MTGEADGNLGEGRRTECSETGHKDLLIVDGILLGFFFRTK